MQNRKTPDISRRHWWTIVAFAVLLGLIFGGSLLYGYRTIEQLTGKETARQAVDVLLQRTYLCGKMEEETRREFVSSAQELTERYSGWTLVSNEQNKYTFRQNVDALAPGCGERAYFGINTNGDLTLFDGLPKDGKVMQTFFQIDTKKLEATLPTEELTLLRQGIRVNDEAEYHSILSTYEEFANTKENDAATMAH
ncbi:forespore regulator of the sigma-K checkpoint [Aneurinibacillus soli]|uniref:Uncharacterized protein n=1 Tax=Aneurinibacillus soli TaxID=1500254 RepID=A0A0U4WE08_9BACL|nr:BofC C-terminal domain-containing protein [Aneurinibacillus soli]PYE62456.1 forespore regulator of the sigma-K checkpoint [Aneurinibacillus soli]BAU27019.1 hypothetical protein CB4_01188 [Aneurinibacillus soli]